MHLAGFRFLLLGGLAVSLGVAPAARGADAIYRCRIEGVPTFSDQPCGPDAATYQAAAPISTYDPPPPGQPAPEVKPAPSKPAPAVAPDAARRQRAEDCGRIKDSLAQIRSKMRAGYRVKEGERLKARQRRLNEQHRDKRC